MITKDNFTYSSKIFDNYLFKGELKVSVLDEGTIFIFFLDIYTDDPDMKRVRDVIVSELSKRVSVNLNNTYFTRQMIGYEDVENYAYLTKRFLPNV